MYKIIFEAPESDRGELIIGEETWSHLPCVGSRISFFYKDQSIYEGKEDVDEDYFEGEDYLVEDISYAYPKDRNRVFVYLKEL